MSGLVCEHVVTRSVRDSAAVLDVLAQPVAGEPYVAPPPTGPFARAVGRQRPLRVGLVTESPTGTAVDAECVAAAEAAARLCESLGHLVLPVRLPVDGTELTTNFINVWAAGNSWIWLDWEERIGRPGREEEVEPLTWALVQMGRRLNAGQYLKSIQGLQRVSRQIAAVFEDVDVLLTPTLGELPPPLGTFDSPPENPLQGLFRAANFVPFTPPFNISGQPAVSLPLHWNDHGLPVGVQLAGRFGDEETLISLSAQLEEAQPWAQRRPPLT
jgi:amidase